MKTNPFQIRHVDGYLVEVWMGPPGDYESEFICSINISLVPMLIDTLASAVDVSNEDEEPEEAEPVVEDREVKLVAYHSNTSKIALFTAEGTYWVGTYFPYRTDCNLDDPYPFVMKYGYFDTKEEGLACLAGLTGEEF